MAVGMEFGGAARGRPGGGVTPAGRAVKIERTGDHGQESPLPDPPDLIDVSAYSAIFQAYHAFPTIIVVCIRWLRYRAAHVYF
jgi:hypothetical protein